MHRILNPAGFREFCKSRIRPDFSPNPAGFADSEVIFNFYILVTMFVHFIEWYTDNTVLTSCAVCFVENEIKIMIACCSACLVSSQTQWNFLFVLGEVVVTCSYILREVVANCLFILGEVVATCSFVFGEVVATCSFVPREVAATCSFVRKEVVTTCSFYWKRW